MAAQDNRGRITELLINNGADPSIVNKVCSSVNLFARKMYVVIIAELLCRMDNHLSMLLVKKEMQKLPWFIFLRDRT